MALVVGLETYSHTQALVLGETRRRSHSGLCLARNENCRCRHWNVEKNTRESGRTGTVHDPFANVGWNIGKGRETEREREREKKKQTTTTTTTYTVNAF